MQLPHTLNKKHTALNSSGFPCEKNAKGFAHKENGHKMSCKHFDKIFSMRNEQLHKLQTTFGNWETRGFKFTK